MLFGIPALLLPPIGIGMIVVGFFMYGSGVNEAKTIRQLIADRESSGAASVPEYGTGEPTVYEPSRGSIDTSRNWRK